MREIVFDPARYSRTFMLFDEEGMPVVSYPNTAERMVPATAKFYEAVMNGSFTHSGHEALNRHVANSMTKTSSRGLMIQKANSKKKIDACVASIFSYDRATVPVPTKPVARFFSL
jgi:phage terminase large subunit-like protein